MHWFALALTILIPIVIGGSALLRVIHPKDEISGIGNALLVLLCVLGKEKGTSRII